MLTHKHKLHNFKKTAVTMSDKNNDGEKVDRSAAAPHDEAPILSVAETKKEEKNDSVGAQDQGENVDDDLPEETTSPKYFEGQTVKVIEDDGSERFYTVVSMNSGADGPILSMVAAEQKKAETKDVENLKVEKNDVIDGNDDMGVTAISSALEKAGVTVKEEKLPPHEHTPTKSVQAKAALFASPPPTTPGNNQSRVWLRRCPP